MDQALPGRLPRPDGWEAVVQDERSVCNVRRGEASALTNEELSSWWDALHPRQFLTREGAWDRGHHNGVELLRSTAWWVAQPCTCEYVYVDTHQPPVRDPKLSAAVNEITQRVAAVCGVEASPPNSCNLNYYPPGGGVGWHADDEPIFGTPEDEKLIISLSLAAPADDRTSDADGRRSFELRRSKGEDDQTSPAEYTVQLNHGDLVTMEGLFQTEYEHSVWPGDDMTKVQEGHKSAVGARINMTWRWVRHHLPACPAGRATSSL
jgi:alkylated DNA repair dioxygenase AlkB